MAKLRTKTGFSKILQYKRKCDKYHIKETKLEIACENQETKTFSKCVGNNNKMYESKISMKIDQNTLKKEHDEKKREMVDTITLWGFGSKMQKLHSRK